MITDNSTDKTARAILVINDKGRYSTQGATGTPDCKLPRCNQRINPQNGSATGGYLFTRTTAMWLGWASPEEQCF